MEETRTELMEEREPIAAEEPAAEEAPAPQGRPFEQEVRELLKARPELRGEALPQAVIDACIRGKSVTEAYNDYARQQRTRERTRQQNAAAASRAPVRAVTRGGGVQTKPEDPFLRGFHTEW